MDSSSEVLAASLADSLACSLSEAVVEASALLGGTTFDIFLYMFIQQKGRTWNGGDQLNIF